MKLLLQIILLYKRSLKQILRTPVWIFVSLFQSLFYLFLFMPLLKNLKEVSELPFGKTPEVFIPGLLVLLSLFSSAFVGFGLLNEIRSGVLARFLVTPVSRAAILLGRIFRDVTILVAQCVLIVIFAIPFGLKVNFLSFFLSIFLYILTSITVASMSYSLALIYKTEDILAPAINMIILPISLLSGIFLPLTLAPLWLQNIAIFNPFFYVVNASRALFSGNYLCQDVLYGFVILFLLTSIMLTVSLKALKRISF